ncbi:hypothetical protein [Arenibacter latericius]|uniref:hypothetical protein n=1 Tax=Arenibacter latericius TaxID=86104 RepID=UPI0004116E97|nr:hypothetical protein [Arenibacter latericius]
MRTYLLNAVWLLILLSFACKETPNQIASTATQPVYKDVPYLQDYSVKYEVQDEDLHLFSAHMDRNLLIQIATSKGIMRTHDGQFLYPGILMEDKTYRPLTDKNITALTLYQDQFIYLDDKAVLSNAWAGTLYLKHNLPKANILESGADFSFLISDGKNLQYVSKNDKGWNGALENDVVINIKFNSNTDIFYILGEKTVTEFDPQKQQLTKIIEGENFTSLAILNNNLVIGTLDGYLEVDLNTGKKIGEINKKLPWTEITYLENIDGNLWFGSTKGAFMLKDDGKFNYYYGKRWLPGNMVHHISKANDGSILILTDAGLGQIVFEEMTLFDKAQYYEKQVRHRHIRLGFNSTLVDLDNGNIDSGRLSDSDNDGLWTTMYLAGQAFRYSVTKSETALQNCIEAMDAMERLFDINPVPGFPSRSYERSGYIERLGDPERWQHTDDPEWDWKSTTSSDEAIGHIFAYGVMAELMDNELKDRAIVLIDTLMSHIVKNDMYLVDFDGKPTTWGRWNPEYVNARPKMVGDRKINASNIIGMLQTAYHFTGKEKYKNKAFDLMENHGYLDNLMWPMKDVAMAPEDADDWSKMLSESWNHSDDEMYFIGYWGLYRYAFNDSLKTKYKEAIIDHWEIERPEKEGAWNIMTALTGTQEFDLEEAAWYLREHPMDMVTWDIMNSHRKDITFIEPNFREQTLTEVLPPDERRIQRHNGNMFRLDKVGSDGKEEYSAGDIWLLPYWMGRYLGVISEPVSSEN